jgi:hypothetical protein
MRRLTFFDVGGGAKIGRLEAPHVNFRAMKNPTTWLRCGGWRYSAGGALAPNSWSAHHPQTLIRVVRLPKFDAAYVLAASRDRCSHHTKFSVGYSPEDEARVFVLA